jgi:hypothetical protein
MIYYLNQNFWAFNVYITLLYKVCTDRILRSLCLLIINNLHRSIFQDFTTQQELFDFSYYSLWFSGNEIVFNLV